MPDHHLTCLAWPPCCPAASAVLPAFIQSNINKKRTVRCINPKKPLVTLLLPLKNSNLPFLNAGSYVGASLRLNGAAFEIPTFLILAAAARSWFLVLAAEWLLNGHHLPALYWMCSHLLL